MESLSMAIQLAGISLEIFELVLLATLLVMAAMYLLSIKRIATLEKRLGQFQVTTTREIKMVNQGAIGIGRRCAAIEKNLKKPANVASFEAIKEARQIASAYEQAAQAVSTKAPPKPVQKPKDKKSGLTTRAEQALSAWINENKTA
jgi:hypothetical protein